MIKQIMSVFTKEYMKETEYREFYKKIYSDFKLKNNSESVEEKIRRLKDDNYISNFKIKLDGEI